jgi:hypothetical protein
LVVCSNRPPAVRAGIEGALHNPTNRRQKSASLPSAENILPLRGADRSASRRTKLSHRGGAPKKAAGKYEKYRNTQLAAAASELKVS